MLLPKHRGASTFFDRSLNRPVLISAAVTLAIVVVARSLAADYVEFQDGSQRQYGLTVSESEKDIEMILTRDIGGKQRRMKIQRSAIKSHVRTIDSKRLAALKEDNLHEYRDYAEELASLKTDPIAQEFALRLFAICIANGDPKLQKSAALNLPKLATSPDQQWKFQTLAFIYCGNRKLQPQYNETGFSAKSKRQLLRIVQYLRREQFQMAAEFLTNAETRKAIEDSGLLQIEQLASAIEAKMIEPGLRVKLLRLESKLILGEADSLPESKSPSRGEAYEWSSKSAATLPTIKNVFEFDLKATRYRNGRWVRP